MGTSVSHASPPTANWRAVALALRTPALSERRLLAETWRAALNQEEDWLHMLSADLIFRFMTVASEANDKYAGAREAARLVVEAKSNSVAVDLARRALLRSIGDDEPQTAYARRLFGAVTEYLASRDLSGYVGEGGRAATVDEATNLKDRLRAYAEGTAAETQFRPGTSRAAWQRFIRAVVRQLIVQR